MTSGDSKVKYTNDKTADVTSALSESSFFGGDSSRSAASAAPAPLPPRRAGTLHTAYYPPTSTSTQASIPRHPTPDPPAYDHQVGEATIMDGHEGPSYRSPVALPPSPAASMPELIEANGGWDNAQPSWDAAPSWKGTGVAALEYAGWRETSWWDPAIMTTGRIKPGKGYLPCGLIKYLHDEDHSPIRVEVTPPDISSDESSGHTSPSTHTNLPPSRLEITQSIPHPHAYFCRKHNGWVLFRVQRSAVLPSPLYQDADVTVPDPAMRKEKHDCLQEDANSRSAWGQSNRFATHHFHYYRKVVLGSSISPPFKKSHGPANEDPKSHSRNDNMELDSTAVPILSEDEMLLDLSVCCQCQVYIVSSGSRVIPAVVPRQIMHRFINDRQKNPAPGQSGADTVMFCLGTVLRIIENHLWRLKTASLNVGSVSRKIGWDDNIKELFASFGFTHEVAPKQDGQPEGRLCSPKTWGSSKDAAFNRARLLRAWVEIGAIAAEYRKRNATELTGHEYNKLWVTVQYARDEIQREIGAHPDQTPRNEIIENRILEANEKPWLFLGTTFRTHSAAIVEAAYHSQRHCDPINTPTYFSALQDITTWATEHLARDPSTEGLQNLAMVERSKGLWTHEDLRWAHQILGIWDDETSRVMDGLRPEDIREAWRKKLKELSEEAKKMRAVTGGAEWNRPPTMTASKKDLKEAFRIISESMGSTSAMATFDEAIKVYESAMDIDEAYSTLDVPQDLDEDTMVVIFQMRLEDQPLAAKRMKQALSVIAEDRDSARLRTLAETGKDEGPPPPDSSRPEWPRGLQQLGNTCYLNSLLQYFYTIKGLREAILDSNTDLFAGSTVTDDHIKQNRVGGRLVTRREVERSKKFVTHLRKLFNDLQVSDLPSVKPELELAKLALVTSKDEEEEVKSESSVGTAASSLASAATLVDEPMPLASSSNFMSALSPNPSGDGPEAQPADQAQTDLPSSVLGKRPALDSPPESGKESMTVDAVITKDLDRDGFVIIPPPTDTPDSASKIVSPSRESVSTIKDDEDVVMVEPISTGVDAAKQSTNEEPASSGKPPPLPPRKKVEVRNDSVMMFGKQHDVSECMDNCMFQIEAALKFGFGKPGEEPGQSSEAGSVVKRIFYGKLRQLIHLLPPNAETSVPEKEDLFSQLLINVGDEGFDLYDGLNGYFEDTIEFEGKPAKMETSLVELPPILQIQLQRVQFNRDTMQAYKSNAYVKFDESLFVDRFLSAASPEKKIRSKEIQAELQACRERLRVMTQTKGGPYAEALSNSINFLSRSDTIPDISPDIIDALKSERAQLHAELTEYRAQASKLKQSLEDLWKDERQVEYELCSVFIHRGSSPSFGHYFFYSRQLPDHPDSWFKYNDQDVTSVPKSEVLADTTGSTANPYLLVYARKGSDVIQTVKRIPHEQQQKPFAENLSRDLEDLDVTLDLFL